MSTAAVRNKIGRNVRRFWTALLAGANVATVLLLWAVCLTVYLEPSVHPRLAQAGLLFPVLLALNMAYIILWLATSWRYIAIPVVGLLGCASTILDYWAISIPRTVPQDALHVLTYNISYAAEDSAAHLYGNRTIRFIGESDADIICIQEYTDQSTEGRQLNDMLDSLGYERRSHGDLMIASRLPFVGSLAFGLNEERNGCMAWRVSDGRDTLMVINAHLRSNHITMEEKDVYSQALEDKDEHQLKNSGKIVLSRLMAAAARRQGQTDSICDFIVSSGADKILLCGDMNDTPVSYTYHRFSTLLKNAWRERGWGAGISFNRTGFPVHIDHVFMSRGIECFDAHIDNTIKSSDHYPVQVSIRL